MSSLGTVIVIFFGGRLALGAYLPLEDLAAFFLYLNIFYQPIMALGQINEGLQQALGSAERVVSILEAESEIVEAPDALELERALGSVEFRNVSFKYVDSIPVLKDISFQLKPGTLPGGATGGQTTIASLILALRSREGESVDGQDIRHHPQQPAGRSAWSPRTSSS